MQCRSDHGQVLHLCFELEGRSNYTLGVLEFFEKRKKTRFCNLIYKIYCHYGRNCVKYSRYCEKSLYKGFSVGYQLFFTLIDSLFLVYMWMLVIRIVSSWFPEYQDKKILRFIRYYTDPYLNFFRKFIPPIGVLDLSSIAAFFALQIIESIVKGILFR